MSDHIGLDEEQLDRMISSHYRSLDDAAVPIKLHGRIVATVQARMDRRGPAGTPLRLWPLASAGLALLAVAAIAVATLPAFYSSRPTSSATATAQVTVPIASSSGLSSGAVPSGSGASVAPNGSYFQFTVRPGDQLWAIARYFNITVCELLLVNPQIKDLNHLEVGWVLNIPKPGQVKCVAPSAT